MTIRSNMSDIPVGNYERVFGHSKPKVDYSENESIPGENKKQDITLIDDDGKPINRVTSFHKNKIYKQAKQLREDLRDDLCTRSECWDPNDRNVQKMIRNELKNPRTRAYKMAMQAIGADPKDCDLEKLRRR